MTTDLFLKRLYAKLKWRMTAEEARDIVQDYREILDEEQRRGKTEEQALADLGSPGQIVADIISERKPEVRHYLYRPCFILAVAAAALYPLMTVWSDLYGILWPYVTLTEFKLAFILLAPIPALTAYFLGHKQSMSIAASKARTRKLYGVVIISCAITCACSIVVYAFLRSFVNKWPNYNIDSIYAIAWLLEIVPLVIGGAWVFTIFQSVKGGLSLSIHFVYSLLTIIIAHYYNILTSMNFQEQTHLEFIAHVFAAILWFVATAVAGIAVLRLSAYHSSEAR
jgi:uncharacterized membrane protein